MLFAPMLAENTDIKKIEQYIIDDNYVFEQKLDGKRLLLKVEDGVVEAANRKGEPPGDAQLLSALGQLRSAFAHLAGEWAFDGEWVHDQFWIFDLPYALDVVGSNSPYADRREALESVFEVLELDPSLFRLLDVARTCEEKRALLQWCQEHDSEGIMVKSVKGEYHPGRRTAAMLKAKFWQTADCLIGEVRREGKASCSIFLLHNGVLTDIGSIKMTELDLQRAKTGDVVECKYLYCTNDMRLYGPCTFLKWRDDKDPSECTTDQLRFVNKSIREATLTRG